MKKLIPALCMLLVAATLLGTSTYAWFSMNETVKATGMSVTAKSESIYLVISETNVLGTGTEVAVQNFSGEVLPVAYSKDGISSVAAKHWYTASGTSTSDGTAKADSQVQLDITQDGIFGVANSKNYYLFKDFYVGLAAGSSNVVTKGIQADVTFNATKESALNKSLTVKIVYGDNELDADATTQTFVYDNATGEVKKYSTALQDNTLISTNATKVRVYIYFDGNHTACTTANAINLDDINISISFAIEQDLHHD